MTKIKNNLKFFIFYYLPAFFWMGLIFYLSSISGLKTGVPSLGWEIFFKKVAHLGEYIILVILIWRIFKNHWKMDFLKSSSFAFIIALIFAFSDEFHQSFVEDRAGRGGDVLVDGIGISIGILGLILWIKIKAKK